MGVERALIYISLVKNTNRNKIASRGNQTAWLYVEKIYFSICSTLYKIIPLSESLNQKQ